MDTLYDSLPPSKEGLADTSTTIGVSLLSGFALMLLCVCLGDGGILSAHRRLTGYRSVTGDRHSVESLTPHPTHSEGGSDDNSDDEGSAEHTSLRGSGHSDDLPRFHGNGHGHSSADTHAHAHTDDDDATHVPTPEEREAAYYTGPYKGSPESLRMDSHSALFPKRQGQGPRRQRSYGRSRDKPADRCQEAEGGASGGGIAGLNATLGLVIHAMADGIALGSSSLSPSSGLGLVVFLAVIVHKGVSWTDVVISPIG